jgi:hypothetical protein
LEFAACTNSPPGTRMAAIINSRLKKTFNDRRNLHLPTNELGR